MTLRHTTRALGHLEAIRTYLLERDPQVATKVLGRIGAAVALLREFPYLGHETAVPGARVIVAAGLPYLVVYGVSNNEIIILGVFHAAQDKKP